MTHMAALCELHLFELQISVSVVKRMFSQHVCVVLSLSWRRESMQKTRRCKKGQLQPHELWRGEKKNEKGITSAPDYLRHIIIDINSGWFD